MESPGNSMRENRSAYKIGSELSSWSLRCLAVPFDLAAIYDAVGRS